MKRQSNKSVLQTKGVREHRVSFMLNNDELQAVERHLLKYKITNRSNWYRTTILTHVLKVMEEDYPTLFNEHDMRR